MYDSTSKYHGYEICNENDAILIARKLVVDNLICSTAHVQRNFLTEMYVFPMGIQSCECPHWKQRPHSLYDQAVCVIRLCFGLT